MKWCDSALSRLILFVAITIASAGLDGNPYTILGLSRSATKKDIRSAYMRLVKEWHPDKNSDPDAADKFVQIKLAYELLSNPERRHQYDQKGITEEPSPFQRYDNFHSPFDDLFNQFGPNYQESDITFFHKLSITARQYDKIIVPRSERTPYLIFFYTDWCFHCIQNAPSIRKLIEYLEPLGINLVTVHSSKEPSLARRMNIHSLPNLVLLLDGNPYVYKGLINNISKIIEFIKKKMPYNLVPDIYEDQLDDFLTGWEDNRVRGLIFEPRESVRLRYLITAYHFRHRVAFGFAKSKSISMKYQVPLDMDTILVFNENTTRPVATVTMKDIPFTTLHDIISSHQFLALPRLSSQGILESLCPCEWNKPRKRLCVVLVTQASSAHDKHRESFRSYAQNIQFNKERVRFAYIYHDKQSEFINSLIPEEENIEPLLKVVIIWRRDVSQVKYEWLTDEWNDNESNDTAVKLEMTIRRLLQTKEELTYKASVNELMDEHAKGIFSRILTKIIVLSTSFYDSLDRQQVYPALSILATILFIILLGYVMSSLVKMEEESIQKQQAKMKKNNNNDAPAHYQPELRLHELRAEKYNGLVRLLKPGCRTILLVLDMKSRETLIPPFHRAVWPYRKNKTLMFSFMYVERGLSWYKEILELSLPDGRSLNINPRNCVGTVLSLNGHRKYFCMFHAKHTERNKKSKQTQFNPQKVQAQDPEIGQFLGWATDSSDDESEEVLLQENLLDGLPNWLDRLFEGSTHRYHINYWPDFPNK